MSNSFRHGAFLLLVAYLAIERPEGSSGQDAPVNETTPEAFDVSPVDAEQRQWFFRADGLAWKRRRMDDRAFVVANTDNRTLLRTSAWTTPLEAGGRFALGKRLSERQSLEIAGFFFPEFDDYAAITLTPGEARQPFFNHANYPNAPPIGGAPALVELEYSSEVYNLELAYRHWLADEGAPVRLGLLAGPRFFFLHERFADFDSQGPTRGGTPLDSVYRTSTENHLYGGQIGLLIEVNPLPTLSIVSETRWGGFWNDSTATNALVSSNGTEIFHASTPESRYSGIVEFELVAHWRVTPRLAVRAGYHAMYFWSMTSAPDVVAFNLRVQSKGNDDLAFWVHGPAAGIEWNF